MKNIIDLFKEKKNGNDGFVLILKSDILYNLLPFFFFSVQIVYSANICNNTDQQNTDIARMRTLDKPTCDAQRHHTHLRRLHRKLDHIQSFGLGWERFVNFLPVWLVHAGAPPVKLSPNFLLSSVCAVGVGCVCIYTRFFFLDFFLLRKWKKTCKTISLKFTISVPNLTLTPTSSCLKISKFSLFHQQSLARRRFVGVRRALFLL